MGRFTKGILGGFSGKIGNVIGGSWKGIDYMRSLSDRRKREPTEKQIIQRARFAYAVNFLQPLHQLIRQGYRNQANRKSPINAALAHVLKKVIEGDYPSYQINYAKLEIAKGLLTIPNTHQVQINADQIEFSWTDSAVTLEDHGDNHALLLAIGEGLYPACSINEFKRSDQSGTLALPPGPANTAVHCYLAFAHESEATVSNSHYLGSVTLT